MTHNEGAVRPDGPLFCFIGPRRGGAVAIRPALRYTEDTGAWDAYGHGALPTAKFSLSLFSNAMLFGIHWHLEGSSCFTFWLLMTIKIRAG